MTGKEFARLLEKHGWELKRVKGSHHVYMKTGNPARISVPILWYKVFEDWTDETSDETGGY